jgi:hypothetical protein
LRVRQASLRGQRFFLSDYFVLFDVVPDEYMASFYLDPHIRPVKFSQPGIHTFFRLFLNSSGVLDYTSLYFDIPQVCRCDLACCEKHISDDENLSRLMEVQAKNEITTSIAALFMTLHPGTQYLNNWSRKYLIAGISPWRGSQMSGIESQLQDHIAFFSGAILFIFIIELLT